MVRYTLQTSNVILSRVCVNYLSSKTTFKGESWNWILRSSVADPCHNVCIQIWLAFWWFGSLIRILTSFIQNNDCFGQITNKIDDFLASAWSSTKFQCTTVIGFSYVYLQEVLIETKERKIEHCEVIWWVWDGDDQISRQFVNAILWNIEMLQHRTITKNAHFKRSQHISLNFNLL